MARLKPQTCKNILHKLKLVHFTNLWGLLSLYASIFLIIGDNKVLDVTQSWISEFYILNPLFDRSLTLLTKLVTFEKRILSVL